MPVKDVAALEARIVDLEARLAARDAVVKAAAKDPFTVFDKGRPGSRLFKHDMIIHGGVAHRPNNVCELCDALAALDAAEKETP